MAAPTLQAPAPTSSSRHVMLWWVPTLIWLGVLASFSTDTFSADHTGRILWKLLHFVYGDISPVAFERLHFVVRKSAHFFSYGFLSAAAFFSWRASLPELRAWSARWCGLALLLTLLAGSADEFHQSFVPSRTSTWHDVVIDMTGAVCFQLVIAGVMRRRMKSQNL